MPAIEDWYHCWISHVYAVVEKKEDRWYASLVVHGQQTFSEQSYPCRDEAMIDVMNQAKKYIVELLGRLEEWDLEKNVKLIDEQQV